MQFWTPLIQDKPNGQLCLVPGSHSWGHTPHVDIKPINLPESYEKIETDMGYGDVIIFHALTLHKTAEFKEPSKTRLALPMVIRNFRDHTPSFEYLRNYAAFNLSPISLIKKSWAIHT